MSALFDWAIVIGAMASTSLSFWLIPLALFVVGNRQHAIAFLGHDGAHRLITRNDKVNDVLCTAMCFWPLGISLNGYRAFHFKHHAFLGTENDPEPKFILPSSLRLAYVRFGSDLFGNGWKNVVMALRLMIPSKIVTLIGPVTFVISTALLLIYFGYGLVVILWFAALYSSFWAAFRMRIWIEYASIKGTHRVELNCWERLLFAPHNSEYHWEHHLYSDVPYSQLPAIRERVQGNVRIITTEELFRKCRSVTT
jgi:fatty acid desaturase